MRKEKLYIKSRFHDVITLYIAQDTSLEKVKRLLRKEEPIIQNIKSRETRQSLEKAFLKVKHFIENPPFSENGYIIVSSAKDFAYLNEIPVRKDLYKCGNEFYSAPLEEALALKLNPIGIVSLDTKEATLAYIGTKIEILKHMTSGIPGKHGKGGQSQRRFERNRKEKIKHFFKRIGKASSVFLSSYPITELIISGCGLTKEKFLKEDYLDYRLKEKVKIVLDTQYTGEYGIRETFHKALPLLEKNAFAQEVKIVEEFFEILGKHFEYVVYGSEELKREMPLIRKLIKTEEHKDDFPEFKGKVIVLRFRGEHYEKIRSLGGICGLKVDFSF